MRQPVNMIERLRERPPPSGSVAASLAVSLIDFAAHRGADRRRLLAAAQLSEGPLGDIDARVPLDGYLALIGAAKQECDDPALALHWAEAVGMAEVSILGLIMESAPTMGEAFRQLQRYGRLATEIETPDGGPRYELVKRGGDLLLVQRPMPWGDIPALTEGALVRLTCGPRRFLDRPHVLAVQFAFDRPAYWQEYERVFQCPVRFNADVSAMTLHPDIASWPVAQLPGYAFAILTDKADTLLSDLDAARTMRGQVEAALLLILHEGGINADRIAAHINISRQTLFRRLQNEGTTFREVLRALRQKLAISYLRGQKISVNETAYLLGFSEAAAFSRAFSNWTGQSPKAFRLAQQRARCGGASKTQIGSRISRP